MRVSGRVPVSPIRPSAMNSLARPGAEAELLSWISQYGVVEVGRYSTGQTSISSGPEAGLAPQLPAHQPHLGQQASFSPVVAAISWSTETALGAQLPRPALARRIPSPFGAGHDNRHALVALWQQSSRA